MLKKKFVFIVKTRGIPMVKIHSILIQVVWYTFQRQVTMYHTVDYSHLSFASRLPYLGGGLIQQV